MPPPPPIAEVCLRHWMVRKEIKNKLIYHYYLVFPTVNLKMSAMFVLRKTFWTIDNI